MNNKKNKVAFCSLGCKVNQYETNVIMQEFIEKGYEVKEFNEYADVYIINTCTVTNIADRKSRQMIRKVKDINPEGLIVACGCYAQVGKEELQKIKEIDLILGNNEKKELVDSIEKLLEQNYNINENILIENVTDVLHQNEYIEFKTETFVENARASIKIQDGCDRFCSYCIIPYARGKVRSRKVENIIKEVKKIAAKGIKEIVITGIHIASYGKDFDYSITIIDVLEKINSINGIERIRLSSLEPTIITNEFIQRLSKLNKICPHFHLSLQSGCNDTLKRMNRKYTIEEFENCVNIIRKKYNKPIITTDIIVGFPGETESEFENTYEFLKKMSFYKMHIFKYSQRKGTKAANMPNQIDGKVKEERSRKLIKLSNEGQLKYNNSKINEVCEVLFEENDGEYYKGHTKDYFMVKIKSVEDNLQNKIENVIIFDAQSDCLIGKLSEK